MNEITAKLMEESIEGVKIVYALTDYVLALAPRTFGPDISVNVNPETKIYRVTTNTIDCTVQPDFNDTKVVILVKTIQDDHLVARCTVGARDEDYNEVYNKTFDVGTKKQIVDWFTEISTINTRALYEQLIEEELSESTCEAAQAEDTINEASEELEVEVVDDGSTDNK